MILEISHYFSATCDPIIASAVCSGYSRLVSSRIVSQGCRQISMRSWAHFGLLKTPPLRTWSRNRTLKLLTQPLSQGRTARRRPCEPGPRRSIAGRWLRRTQRRGRIGCRPETRVAETGRSEPRSHPLRTFDAAAGSTGSRGRTRPAHRACERPGHCGYRDARRKGSMPSSLAPATSAKICLSSARSATARSSRSLSFSSCMSRMS